MNVALISFTRQGAKTCKIIEAGLRAQGHGCKAFGKPDFAKETELRPLTSNLKDWTKRAFSQEEVLIFVGATGIAVRAIAPYIKSKITDPAVIVVDELEKYAISLLSGHLGGANEMTLAVAALIGAEPVITTATDINGLFAVDQWAKKQNLCIENMAMVKKISAALLNGEDIGVASDYAIGGILPKQLIITSKDNGQGENITGEKGQLGLSISIYNRAEPFTKTLRLVPRILTLGVGCRKGTSIEAIMVLLEMVLKKNDLSIHGIERICSIDIKKEEKALKELAHKLDVPFQVYSAEELKKVPGDFTPSDFVNEITGVDNVCERAAVLGSQGQLTIKKQALNGVTIAIAIREEEYKWTY